MTQTLCCYVTSTVRGRLSAQRCGVRGWHIWLQAELVMVFLPQDAVTTEIGPLSFFAPYPMPSVCGLCRNATSKRTNGLGILFEISVLELQRFRALHFYLRKAANEAWQYCTAAALGLIRRCKKEQMLLLQLAGTSQRVHQPER